MSRKISIILCGVNLISSSVPFYLTFQPHLFISSSPSHWYQPHIMCSVSKTLNCHLLNAFANLTYLCIQNVYHLLWLCMYECIKKQINENELNFIFPFKSTNSFTQYLLSILIISLNYFHKIDALWYHLYYCSLPQMCNVSIIFPVGITKFLNFIRNSLHIENILYFRLF